MSRVRMPGFRGYSSSPDFAWSGWRHSIPGGPVGGQYHGFIGPDSLRSWAPGGGGWPFGPSELSEGPQIRPSGHSQLPQQGTSKGPWDKNWGGTAFREGQTHSDYIYRSPGETRPRPNASGGTNVVRGKQTQHAPGYAEAPGNYKALGAVPSGIPVGASIAVRRPYGMMPGESIEPRYPYFGPDYQPPTTIPSRSSGATSTVLQPAPATPAPQYMVPWTIPPASPAPAPTVAASPADYMPSQGQIVPGITPGYSLIDSPPPQCAPGYINSGPSGSCMPTTGAPQCATGYTLDPLGSGACVSLAQASASASGVPATSGFSAWLSEQTIIPGLNNEWVALAAGFALILMMKGKK
jgi:hypothetical protein